MDRLRRFIIFFVAAFICLYFAFFPAVSIPYVNHDSIRYFHKFYNHAADAVRNPQYEFSYFLGRPLQAELAAFLYKYINCLSDMSWLRAAVIGVSALSAAVLGDLLVTMGVGPLEGFCFSTAVFTFPGVQESIFVPYLNNALSGFIALLAFYVWSSGWGIVLRLIVTLVLLATAFLGYPPSGFLFLLPVVLASILGRYDWLAVRKKCFEAIGLWLTAAVVYYVFLKIFFYGEIKLTHHEIDFSGQQVLSNIRMFFPVAMPQIFNLWNIYYSKSLGVLMMAITGIFLVMDLFVFRKPLGGQRFLVVFTIFLLCNMVWFAFGGYLPRTFIAAQAIALALVYAGGKYAQGRFAWIALILPVMVLITGLVCANRTTVFNVRNNNAELMFVQSRLMRCVDTSTQEIHVVLLKNDGHGYNGLPTVYDNFNGTTPDYEIPDLIRVALKDLPNPFELHCRVTVSNYGESFVLTPYTAVMDMNNIPMEMHK